MSEDKQTKIDIPESIEGYKVTLFWGLTAMQIILVFMATLFAGFGIFSIASKRFTAMTFMFLITGLMLLGIIEIRGRNFYRHILFIVSYYKTQTRVLIYNHYSASGDAREQNKHLIYEQTNNTKTFVGILIAIVIGLILLILISIYIYHVIHTQSAVQK